MGEGQARKAGRWLLGGHGGVGMYYIGAERDCSWRLAEPHVIPPSTTARRGAFAVDCGRRRVTHEEGVQRYIDRQLLTLCCFSLAVLVFALTSRRGSDSEPDARLSPGATTSLLVLLLTPRTQHSAMTTLDPSHLPWLAGNADPGTGAAVHTSVRGVPAPAPSSKSKTSGRRQENDPDADEHDAIRLWQREHRKQRRCVP